MRRLILTLSFLFAAITSLLAADRPNVLIITVDDMSCDSIGVFGCPLPSTPNIDRLAKECLRFDMAHVQVGNCYPSRNVLFSGRYPHNSGVEGFYQVRDTKYPVMCDLMKEAGYYVAIRGKVSHSTPYSPYAWDDDLTEIDGKQLHIKDPASYGLSTARGIENAKKAGKPFCLDINISDPHKPFWHPNDPHPSSKVFTAEEVPVPGFLFDDPVVREELALYYTSVRRADDALAQVLAALRESGQEENTIIVFLSDHGMPLPFAKTQLYHHSTHTPLMIKWPGVTRGGSVDREHMVSAVDFLPTLLDMIGLKHPEGLDGRSFEPLLRGEKQSGRDFVFKVYNENSGGVRDPMRAIETKDFLYIFNPWSDGTRVFRTATQGTDTYRQMKKLAPDNPTVAARLELMDHRKVEELYNVKTDPDCLNDLMHDPFYADTLKSLRKQLNELMTRTGDHALDAFKNRKDPAALTAYVNRVQEESDERRSNKGKKGAKPEAAPKKKYTDLITLENPADITAGQAVKVSIPHQIPAKLGEQKIQVTLKEGSGKRIERKIFTVSGDGTLEVSFDLPAKYAGQSIAFAAFVGEDFPVCLQHVTTKPVTVK